MRSLLAIGALLLFAGSAHALQGTAPVTGTNGRVAVDATVTQVGSCVGDVPTDFCGTVDFTSSVITGGDWSLDTLAIGGTLTAGYELDVTGDVDISQTLNVGSDAGVGGTLQVTGILTALTSLVSPTVYGGTSTGNDLTLDANSADSTVNGTQALIIAVNPIAAFNAATAFSGAASNGAFFTNSGAGIHTFATASSGFAGLSVGGDYQFDSTTATTGALNAVNFTSRMIGSNGATSYNGPRTIFSLPVVDFDTASGAHTLTGAHGMQHGVVFDDPDGTSTATISRTTGLIMNGWNVDDDWTITTLVAVAMPSAGLTNAGTITNFGAIEIEDFTPGGTVTNMFSIWNKDPSANMLHEGDAIFGADQGTLTAPSATLHAREQTDGQYVFQLDTDQTNDNPNYRIIQDRNTSTTSGDVVLQAIPIASGQVYMVEARVVGICTSGAACTAGTGIGCVRNGLYTNIGGTTSEVEENVGFINDPLAGDIGATCKIDANNTNDTIDVTITGVANESITWHVTTIVQNLSAS